MSTDTLVITIRRDGHPTELIHATPEEMRALAHVALAYERMKLVAAQCAEYVRDAEAQLLSYEDILERMTWCADALRTALEPGRTL